LTSDEPGITSSHKSVRLGSASAYALSAQLLTLTTGFVASVLVARTLGPAGKGQLSVLQQVPGILAVLLNMGISTANTYFVGKGKHGVGEVLGNSLLAAAVLGAVGAPVALLFTVGAAAVVPSIPLAAGIIAAVYLPMLLASQYLWGINVGVGEMKALARTQMAGSITSVSVIALAFATGHLSVTTAIMATALNVVVGLSLNATRLIRHHADGVRLRLAHMRESARYAAKAYFGNLAGYLNYRADIIIVGYIAGAATVGVYSIAVTFAELMWYAPNALSSALLSKSMQTEDEDAQALALRSSRVTAGIMLAICLVAGLLIAPVVRIVYGDAFRGAIEPFLLLLPGVWMIGIARVLSANLASRGLLYPWIAALSAGTNILMNVLLVPRLGASGAAIASTVSYGGGGLATMFMFAHNTGAKPRDWLLPTGADRRAITRSLGSYWGALRARFGSRRP
jgi:O-antigen/teichoic acid export membrane protein